MDPSVHPSTLAGTHAILVVDDVGIRRQAYRVLAAAGYRVFEAATRSEVQEVLQSWGDRLPLVILDVASPSLNGLPFAEHVRTVHPDARILLTAPPGVSLDQERLAATGAALVHKPFSPDDLLRTVHYILHSPSL